jgi:hypothetical protein
MSNVDIFVFWYKVVKIQCCLAFVVSASQALASFIGYRRRFDSTAIILIVNQHARFTIRMIQFAANIKIIKGFFFLAFGAHFASSIKIAIVASAVWRTF